MAKRPKTKREITKDYILNYSRSSDRTDEEKEFVINLLQENKKPSGSTNWNPIKHAFIERFFPELTHNDSNAIDIKSIQDTMKNKKTSE